MKEKLVWSLLTEESVSTVMAASAPVPTNSKVGEPASATMGGTTPQRLMAFEAPKLSQRGHNKPKCIKCGNVARSRCPFQSCKNCCAKAQNPCHIHVLKQSSILPVQPPPTTPLPEQPSPDVPSTGSSWRLSSLRQLSTAFVSSMRVKKPLTRKDAVNINKWRFAKLKEHIEGNIEAENEAFDRYLWNVSLLEEAFSTEGLTSDGSNDPEPISSEDKFQKLVASMKVMLRSNPDKAESCRGRINNLVVELLRKLQERDFVADVDELDTCKALKRQKRGELWADRTASFGDLIEKLSKARTEDDLKSCMELKHQLLHHSEIKDVNPSGEEVQGLKKEADALQDLSVYVLPKMCTVVQTDQEAVSKIGDKLLSVGQLVEL